MTFPQPEKKEETAFLPPFLPQEDVLCKQLNQLIAHQYQMDDSMKQTFHHKWLPQLSRLRQLSCSTAERHVSNQLFLASYASLEAEANEWLSRIRERQ